VSYTESARAPSLACLATLLAGGLFLLAGACASGEVRTSTDSADVATVDTMPPPPPAAIQPRLASAAALPPLSGAAESVLPYLAFAPVGQEWFIAVARHKRMFVDIGRVDADVNRDSARAMAFREVVAKRATVAAGTTFRLRGACGAFDVKAGDAEAWNGRIVLRITGPSALDSIMRGRNAVFASAFRTDTESAVSRDSCNRTKPIEPDLATRLSEIRDSLERELRDGPQPLYERLRGKMTVASSQVAGCFGSARHALVVTLRSANAEWVRERLVLVDSTGRTMPMRVGDYRFRAHELLQAFDADGDGVDDLVTRAITERASATTILGIDLKSRRASRLAVGFANEQQP
jgi:hypothetical protein